MVRRFSLPAHALVELAAGIALMIAALALSLGVAGTMALFSGGVVLAGIGLGAADSLPLAAHQALDRWVATLVAVAAIGLVINGDATGAVVMLLVATGQLLLTGTTRWSRPAPAGS